MKRVSRSRGWLPVLLVFSTLFCLRASGQWTVPTEEELKMTSQPEVPGAAAVYLFKEEITEDKLHMWSVYVRLKVLTERGKENANVELKQYQASERGGYTVGDIQARTIHSDGTIIPFTGKPYEKLIEKNSGYNEMAKVFTLPDVEVGSILEYRYKLRYDDDRYIAPTWFIQTDMYLRKGHYLWRPTDRQLITKNERGEQLTNSIAWTPILPKGAVIQQKQTPGTTSSNGQLALELDVHDIPPRLEEEYMPPVESFSYRVLFYYSPYRNSADYWKNEGKLWGKARDKFIGPDSKVAAAAQTVTAGADSQEQKLRKIYAAMMQLDNSVFGRKHSEEEDKSAGLGPPKTAGDIWERKRGTDDQITELFVAMARAAGMKAYVMRLTNRDHSLFDPNYMSFNQLDDLVAIVTVDGKEVYLDPGQRYCAYGHLAWKHSMAQGVRQTADGTAISSTPSEPYTASRTQRVANLKMDERGETSGTVKMTWTGAPALRWRQISLRGDNASLQRDLRTSMERLLPEGLEVKVNSVSDLADYEKPLEVVFDVKGVLGSSTGKRLLLPGELFEARSHATFPHEKREIPIYFDYPNMTQDAIRINFPATFGVESVPVSEKLALQRFASYSLTSESTPTSVTVRREFALGNIIFTVEEYPEVRAFYSKVETKDQEGAVLKFAASQGGN